MYFMQIEKDTKNKTVGNSETVLKDLIEQKS